MQDHDSAPSKVETEANVADYQGIVSFLRYIQTRRPAVASKVLKLVEDNAEQILAASSTR